MNSRRYKIFIGRCDLKVGMKIKFSDLVLPNGDVENKIFLVKTRSDDIFDPCHCSLVEMLPGGKIENSVRWDYCPRMHSLHKGLENPRSIWNCSIECIP